MSQGKYAFKELSDIVPFGIHQGISIGDLITTEPKYVQWCIENFKGFKLYKKIQIHFDNTIKSLKSEE